MHLLPCTPAGDSAGISSPVFQLRTPKPQPAAPPAGLKRGAGPKAREGTLDISGRAELCVTRAASQAAAVGAGDPLKEREGAGGLRDAPEG